MPHEYLILNKFEAEIPLRIFNEKITSKICQKSINKFPDHLVQSEKLKELPNFKISKLRTESVILIYRRKIFVILGLRFCFLNFLRKK